MKRQIDGFHLKIIAILGMLINHMGDIFQWSHTVQTLPLFTISEFVGKFTFPIMAYLLVEGFHYTRSKIKYASRLACFWIISIIPFFLLHNPNYSFSLTDIPNNIFFTLLMGLLMLICYEKTNNRIFQFLIVVVFAALTVFSDWNLFGVILIWAFYKFHDAKGIKTTLALYFVFFEIISIIGLVTGKAIGISIAEIISIFGFLFVGYLLSKYNGDRGYSPRWVKWGFYIFYPLHLIILEAINYFILLP
ncbi:TraX family protein [Lactococcus lactis]|uniref:TraX family protein n=1 Tax=Lactococcus lactis TaxID=1358 RepID=UPI001D19457B|nr:TraX family protein [Lactococcus lactis]MCC4119252.1 conjugal transfer protein TraX [Lactococcus lactis]